LRCVLFMVVMILRRSIIVNSEVIADELY
jgi:hypothetical protein